MFNLLGLIDAEREQSIKLQQVMYLFSKMEIEEKIDLLFDVDGLTGVDDFIDFYFDDLCYEFDLDDFDYTGALQASFKDVKNEWNSLTEDLQYEIVVKYICNDDLEEIIEIYLDMFYDNLESEIERIHWIELMGTRVLPKEDVIAEIKEMMASEGNQALIEKHKIDKNIDLNSLTDEELKDLHYQLEGVIY